jgi:predicted Zn finger-like uncharacterized protein
MSQLVSCPECSKHLQVPDDLIGKKVQCPECKHTFTATAPEESTKISTTPSKPPPSKAPAWDKDDDDERSSKSESKPKKRREEDDEDDDDERPRRRRRSSSGRGDYMPHRGGMILAFGLIGLLIMPIFGIIAWIMGNSDLAEIKAGRMDPEGESMTNAGRILGMIAVILWIVSILVFCGIFGCFFIIGIGAAAGGNRRNNNFPQQPPNKF